MTIISDIIIQLHGKIYYKSNYRAHITAHIFDYSNYVALSKELNVQYFTFF